jgi:hypothetical protein
MGRVMSGSDRVVRSKIMAHARPATRVGLVGFRVVSYNFQVESGWVGLFLSSGENFGLRPTRRTVGSGRVGFFTGGSGRVYRVGHPMIRYTETRRLKRGHETDLYRFSCQ